jgi:CRISPR-associated protein Csx14
VHGTNSKKRHQRPLKVAVKPALAFFQEFRLTVMKKILLALTGLNPQVVMETLYALHQEGTDIDEIHVITTRRGKELIHAHLLSAGGGMFYRYLQEYGIPPEKIAFPPDHIHPVRDACGAEIEDVSTEEDNEQVLRLCLDLTFTFTSGDTAVFFSIAGGRKTMSACLMVAAQLYGRPQDRIYHVLVSPEFEGSFNFFFAPRHSVPIELRDGNGVPFVRETRHAKISLVHVPFFSVREQLPTSFFKGPCRDTSSLFLRMIRDDPYFVTVDFTSQKVFYRKRILTMMPARFALYAFFVEQKKACPRLQTGKGASDCAAGGFNGTPARPACSGCTECYLDFPGISNKQSRITEIYRQLAGSREISEMSDTGIVSLNMENFNSYKGKIRRDFEKAFGLYGAERLAIEARGKRPDTRYGIPLDRDRIRVVM